MDTISKIKGIMDSIIPGVTSQISEQEPLSFLEPLDDGFDLACKEYLAWMLENELNISIDETDVLKWKTFQDICKSVKKAKGQ